MDNSIYIVLSRQQAKFEDMAITANNIANISTPGYNAQKLQFQQFLADAGDAESDKDAYADAPAAYRDTSAGTLQVTNNPFDLAITGHAYFQVQTPLGNRFTKAGNFQLTAEGGLVNTNGYPVVGQDGSPITIPTGSKNVEINASGQIIIDGNGSGQIGMFEFENEQVLARRGNSVFEAPQGVTAKPSVTSHMLQGTLEGSNVNGVMEMTHVLEISRSVNDTAKFIEAMYDLERKSSSTFTSTKNA